MNGFSLPRDLVRNDRCTAIQSATTIQQPVDIMLYVMFAHNAAAAAAENNYYYCYSPDWPARYNRLAKLKSIFTPL